MASCELLSWPQMDALGRLAPGSHPGPRSPYCAMTRRPGCRRTGVPPELGEAQGVALGGTGPQRRSPASGRQDGLRCLPCWWPASREDLGQDPRALPGGGALGAPQPEAGPFICAQRLRDLPRPPHPDEPRFLLL